MNRMLNVGGVVLWWLMTGVWGLTQAQTRTEAVVRSTRLELRLDPRIRSVEGTATLTYTRPPGIDTLILDLDTHLTVNRIRHLKTGLDLGYRHGTDLRLYIGLPQRQASETHPDSIRIEYAGVPPRGQGFGAFTTDTSSVGSPVLWTLSQPYGARTWWPCQQALGYKLDSVTLAITVPRPYKAVANGLLAHTHCIDTLCTYTWHTRYPISPYLVAVSVAEYVTHTLDLTPQASVPLVSRNHLYPADSARFAVDINSRLPGILQVFTEAFGTYPFAEEGCNHAQFTFRGGMEHQTCSFMFNFGFDLTAHELAHQWFGDLVTCGSWSELWLNEGFASWAELYAVERLEPERLLVKREDDIRRAMTNRTGTVLEQDTLNVRHLFNSALRYDKAGIILHQLRHWLGDTCFFNALKAYLADRYHRFGFSRTRGLQHYLQLYCTKALDDYFSVWLASPGYPKVLAKWQQQPDGGIIILLEQTPPQPGLPCLRVPFELRLEGTQADGQPRDTLIRIQDSCEGLAWTGKTDWKVARVELDPFFHWMIDKEIMPQVAVSTFAVLVAPNPAKTELTITWSGSGQAAESIELIDAQGRTVQVFYPEAQATQYLVPTEDLARGLYWLRVRGTKGGLHFAKIVLA